MLLMGETWTCLVQHSHRLPTQDASALLASDPGQTVQVSERPISSVVSDVALIGIDCRLAQSPGPAVRAVGTVASRARLTGGRVLQGSAFVEVVPSPTAGRRTWAHYLARLGVVETPGGVPSSLAQAFLAEQHAPGTLDLGSAARDWITRAQRSSSLDRHPPFRAGRTRLRWAAVSPDEPGDEDTAQFLVTSDVGRSSRVTAALGEVPALLSFFEDLACHDWLLTIMSRAVARRVGPEGTLARIGPALSGLTDLWMPGARTPPALQQAWQGFEQTPGFSRQWSSLVANARDMVSLRTLALLEQQCGPRA